MATVYAKNADGEWCELGEAIEMTFRWVAPDGRLLPPAGACPECCRVPMSDQPVICPHGVALPR